MGDLKSEVGSGDPQEPPFNPLLRTHPLPPAGSMLTLGGWLQAVGDFYAVMGEEMIALTGQRERVEAIISHIQAVVKTIENVDFYPFHVDNAKLWETIMATFWQEVAVIEFDIRKFIDDVFKTVRSAEVAFDTIVTFQHISTRESVSAVLKTKFGDVLDRYDKQVFFTPRRHALDDSVGIARGVQPPGYPPPGVPRGSGGWGFNSTVHVFR